MEDFYAIPEMELKESARSMRRMMKERNWGEIKAIRTAKSFLLFATRPDGKKMRFRPLCPYETSVFARQIADDKVASYFLFKENDIPQPDTEYLYDDETKMHEQIESLLEKHGRIVVKPVDGAHGHGVVTDITDVDTAIEAARKCGRSNAIAQEQLPDDITEIRVICVGKKFVAAYKRIPAAVTGDGEHNIIELIEKENRELRREAYTGGLTKIDEPVAKRYLEKKGIDASRVPVAGEKVRVMSMCNVGMGGTAEIAKLSDDQVALAEKIATVADLPLVGIDFFGDKIIEINAGPMLYYPTGDEWEEKCIEAYLDYLETI